MTKSKPTLDPFPPPDHLTPEAKSWWRSVVSEYELADHHLKLLQAAAESWGRMQAARAILDEKGLTYDDRFGAPRARPEIGVERDSRIAFARLVRELDLDLPPPEAPRPPALRSNRRA